MYYRVEVFSADAGVWYGWTSLRGLGGKILSPEEDTVWQEYCRALPRPECANGLPPELWMTDDGFREFQRIELIFLKVLEGSLFDEKPRRRELSELAGIEVYRNEHYVAVVTGVLDNCTESPEVTFLD